MIPRTTIDAIREKTDLIELVESKGISLKRVGGRYVGLCPVHSERSPSFNVNEQSQTYHCFGCGVSGDAFAFLMEVDGYTFAGAVEALGESAGIEVIDSAGEDPEYLRKKDYLKTLRSASWFYRNKFANLPENHPAKVDLMKREYLEVEGRETWLEDFSMGYAPGGGSALVSFLQSQGYTREQIVDTGLVFEIESTGKLRDRFRDRLMWEIRDIKGHPIGFSGRRMNEEDNPKYLNSPETILYKKSRILVGMDLARKRMSDTKTCYVTEGAADVMAVAATGYTNVVASCGTGFGSEHAAIIRRVIDDFNAKDNGKFVFVFDGDEAGLKAASKMFTDITPSIKDRSYVAALDGLDPVDFRVQFGDAELRKRLDEAQPITEFMLTRIASKYDMREIESRSNFTREAMNIISHFKEPEIFEAYKRKISAMSGVSIGHLQGGRVREEPDQHEEYISPYDMMDAPPDDGGDVDPFDAHEEERPPETTSIDRVSGILIACMLQFPNETFEALKDKSYAAQLVKNKQLQNILIEGMRKTAHTVVRGEPTRLTITDFTNGSYAVPFFHAPLDTEADRATRYVERLVRHLKEIVDRQESENLRAAVATQQIPEAEALAMMLEQRKKKKK